MKPILLLLFLASSIIAQTNPPRVWTLKTGETVAGAYVSCGRQFVVIKTGGTNCLLAVTSLATDDFIYYQSLRIADLEGKLNIGGNSIVQPSGVQTISILTSPDQWGKCEIYTESGKLKVQLKNIPKSVIAYFSTVKQLNEKIEELKSKEKRLRAEAARAAANVNNIRYNGDSDIYAVNSIRSQRSAAAANLVVDANATEADFVESVKELSEMESRRKIETTVDAVATGEKYYDFPCWKCVDK
ncbi:MAG: hypothetical protein WCS94_14220 [Verrucomicrobiota bacterium]